MRKKENKVEKEKDGTRQTKEESGEEERRSSRRICLFYTDIHITHLLEVCYWDQGFILIQYQLLIPYFLPQERRTESSYTEPRVHKYG